MAGTTHPLLTDILRFSMGTTSLAIRHVYREVNSVADWVTSFVAEYLGEVL